MLFKIFSLGLSGLVSLALLGMMPSASQEPEEPPPPKKGPHFPKAKGGEAEKKKAEAGPEGDLQRAYNLLRRLRADVQGSGRAEARTRDWTERAIRYHRDGIRALQDQNPQLAHEYAVIAHDLARVIEHVHNATISDRPDADLPTPPAPRGAGRDEWARRDLMQAYERLREADDGSDAGSEAKYYRGAAGELYQEARRDFQAGRLDRAAELARAAEAMTHVCEHLGHAADDRRTPPPTAEPKRRRGPESREGRGGDILPPPDRP
jgi:hypothetical protein